MSILNIWMFHRAEVLSSRLRFDEALELILAVRAVEPHDDDVEQHLLKSSWMLMRLFPVFSDTDIRASILRKRDACFDREMRLWRVSGTEDMKRGGLALSEPEIVEVIRLSKLWDNIIRGLRLAIWIVAAALSIAAANGLSEGQLRLTVMAGIGGTVAALMGIAVEWWVRKPPLSEENMLEKQPPRS